MTHRQATAALITITLIWGISITAVKALLDHVSPLAGVAVRFGVAALILSPMLRGLRREEFRAGLRIGIIFAFGVALQNTGLASTSASRQAFLLALAAVLTPAAGAIALRHRTPVGVLMRIVVATLGVYLLTSPGGGLSFNRGDLLTLLASVCYAGQIVAVSHYAGRVSVPRLLAVQFAVTSLFAAVTSPIFEAPRLEPSLALLGIVAFLVASSLTTFSLQLRAQRVVAASEAALVYTFEPLVTATASWFLLGETLSAVQWVGAAVILGAVGWKSGVASRKS
jgi:drug/metabolite transporter (DMT)-like permease